MTIYSRVIITCLSLLTSIGYGWAQQPQDGHLPLSEANLRRVSSGVKSDVIGALREFPRLRMDPRYEGPVLRALKSNDPEIVLAALEMWRTEGERLWIAATWAAFVRSEAAPTDPGASMFTQVQRIAQLIAAIEELVVSSSSEISLAAISALAYSTSAFDPEMARRQVWLTQWCGTVSRAALEFHASEAIESLWAKAPQRMLSFLGLDVQVTAALASADIGDERWAALVFDSLAAHLDPRMRACALLAYPVKNSDPVENPPALLYDSSDVVRELSAAYYFDDQEMVEGLARRFATLSVPLRRSVVQMSWHRPGHLPKNLKVRPDLIRTALNDQDDGVRGYALEAAIELGFNPGREYVLRGLSGKHRQLRVSAILALQKWFRSDLQSVRPLLKDPDLLVAETALEVLGPR